MGDVADILQVSSAPKSMNLTKDLSVRPHAQMKKTTKPKGMSRELFALMGQDGIAPSVQPTATGTVGLKSKWTSNLKGKWIFAPFSNSARGDNATFMHWVKADVQYPDYPYAKYNIRPDAISYSDEEYEELLHSTTWTRSETDHLMYLCSKFELRWPVIVDRYTAIPSRSCEDLQSRYYTVVTKTWAHRTNAQDANLRAESHTIFDLDFERKRRMQQEMVFRQDRTGSEEITKLKEEIATIDGEIKKLKKGTKTPGSNSSSSSSSSSSSTGGVMVGGKSVSASSSTGASSSSHQIGSISNNNSGSRAMNVTSTSTMNSDDTSVAVGSLPASRYAVEGDPEDVSIPAPQRSKPALQSSRLVVVEQTPGMSQSMSQKSNWLLRELGVPDYPIATRAVCDMLDSVRKDTVSLLALQDVIRKKENDLKRMQEEGASENRKQSHEMVIPDSMIAGRAPYRPAPAPVSLSMTNVNPNTNRKMNQQKRKVHDMDMGGHVGQGYYIPGDVMPHHGHNTGHHGQQNSHSGIGHQMGGIHNRQIAPTGGVTLAQGSSGQQKMVKRRRA